jgi:NADH-quinone oxidoreductase subunit D
MAELGVNPHRNAVDAEPGEDTYVLNMGPQHPSMHGVLRLRLTMRGEEILEVDPVIGYSHRAQEKMAENRQYVMWLPNTSRMDYLSGLVYNFAYCQAIEKLCGIRVPERAELIRVITGELNRIASHLLWFATFLNDLGGITPFLYAFDDRESVLDVLESVTGSRLTYCYGRFGGVTQDVDDAFVEGTRAFLARLEARLPMYDKLVDGNVIFRERTIGVGVMPKELAAAYGVTGPNLRAMGVPYDVRRAEPYGIYDRFDFAIPTREGSDCYARFCVRVEEITESMGIVAQALDRLEPGPVMAEKVPKRIKLPKGDFYYAVESPRGHLGLYLVSDGGESPTRLKVRTPSFSNLSAMPAVLPGTMVADTVAIVGSIDIVLPEVDR